MCASVAPPRGERGLKCVAHVAAVLCAVVAPPRGERGLKCAVPPALRLLYLVAPPRGERGLKCLIRLLLFVQCHRRSPSWGAWIEISMPQTGRHSTRGRSPSWGAWIEMFILREKVVKIWSLPLVGSVD